MPDPSAILTTLRDLEAGSISTAQAARFVMRFIGDRLRELQIPANALNATDLGQILFTEIFPDEPRSIATRERMRIGEVTCSSDGPPEHDALPRGCGILMADLEYATTDASPRKAAKMVGDYLFDSGILPDIIIE